MVKPCTPPTPISLCIDDVNKKTSSSILQTIKYYIWIAFIIMGKLDKVFTHLASIEIIFYRGILISFHRICYFQLWTNTKHIIWHVFRLLLLIFCYLIFHSVFTESISSFTSFELCVCAPVLCSASKQFHSAQRALN